MPFDHIPAADSQAERIARLRLARSSRVGPVHFAQLMIRFGSAQAALAALPGLSRRGGGQFTAAPQAMIDAELALADTLGARLMVLGDDDYPALLRQVDAAPPVLWTLGPLKTHNRAVALVGARNASAAGQTMARALAHDLSQAGFQIVSGLARGIDARAHEASLAGGTVAILGGGVDDVYPPDNASLYARIKAEGLLISESPVGYRAQARDFPRRNRIISGLCLATVVVEAELRSGSLITARLAAEQNREVFAVPGSPLDPRSRGVNDLLRQGANLCETAEDVMRVLEAQMGFSAPHYGSEVSGTAMVDSGFVRDPVASHLTATQPPSTHQREDDISRALQSLRSLISTTPVSRDTLLRLSQVAAPAALCALSELEIAGVIHDTGSGYVLSKA